jgi:TrmH family RNA methyltransferase
MTITSSQNSRVKLARMLLSSRKERESNHLFIVEGVRLSEEALIASTDIQFALFSSQLSERGKRIINALNEKKVDVEQVEDGLFERVSDTRTSQGIMLVLSTPQPHPKTDNQTILILDQISDPGNMGTLLRSAAGFGFTTVISTFGSVDFYSPKVVRSAMGAHFRCGLWVKEIDEIKEVCKISNQPPLEILFADSQASQSCWKMNLSVPLGLVIGSEAVGPSDALRSIADGALSIPMVAGIESFNAAVSGSILMYEIFRQRMAK